MRRTAEVLPGLGALIAILGPTGAALLGLFLMAGPDAASLPWPYVGRVLRFTTLQAALSTAISVLFGAALALALGRRRDFFGRRAFVAAMNLASVLPAVVAVFGIVAVFGRAGWLAALPAGGVFGERGFYGLPAILIAHVFFNTPLAARIFLASLEAVPGETWRLAAQLGMGPSAILRFVDLPILAREAPSVAALIFLLCFTSFAIVLALGGGPASATLEVAIYEAIRFDVDFSRAALLALIQVAIGVLLALPVLASIRRPAEMAGGGASVARPDARLPATRLLDGAALAAGAALILPPLAAVLLAGLRGWQSLVRADVGLALGTSLAIAPPAAVIAVVLALAIATSARGLQMAGHERRARLMSLPGGLVLAVPPLALSAGLLALSRSVAEPFSLAAPLIVFVNALMAVPFALRQVEPPLLLSAERYGFLAESLGLKGVARLRVVEWPLLARPLGAALAITAALSLGDLGVTAFFGDGRIVTLPLLLYQRMGAYRMDEAAAVALLLATLALTLFLAAQRWSGDPLARSR